MSYDRFQACTNTSKDAFNYFYLFKLCVVMVKSVPVVYGGQKRTSDAPGLDLQVRGLVWALVSNLRSSASAVLSNL